MAKAKPKRAKKKKSGHRAETRITSIIDQLNAFEEFRQDVLPRLRSVLAKGYSAEQIYKEFSDLAAARAITIAMTEQDSSKALAALKEVLDRAHGKATERKELKTTISSLSDEELDALLHSEEQTGSVKKQKPKARKPH